MKHAPGTLRIISGAWRRRIVDAPEGDAIRPTSERAREGLFNRLAHAFADFQLAEARVIDVFAGTGVLGLEALSRGAAHATFIENSAEAAALIRRNVATLKAEDRALVLGADATHLPMASQRCDLALLDPPYGKGLAALALASLARQGWLASGALVTVETEADEALPEVDGFTLLDRRAYSRAGISFLKYVA